MDNNTNIVYEQVLANANTIRDCSNKMQAIFEEFRQTINQATADGVFEGQASEALKNRFNSLKGRFDSYTAKVEEFASMISSASEQTASTEKNIAGEADRLAG